MRERELALVAVPLCASRGRASDRPAGRDVSALKLRCAPASPELLSAAGGEHERSSGRGMDAYIESRGCFFLRKVQTFVCFVKDARRRGDLR